MLPEEKKEFSVFEPIGFDVGYGFDHKARFFVLAAPLAKRSAV